MIGMLQSQWTEQKPCGSYREIGKAPENDHKLELEIGNKIISNPTEFTEKLNVYFISTVEELVKQNSNRRHYNKLDRKHCPNFILIHPVTEEESY
jgi:hypothetical protein